MNKKQFSLDQSGQMSIEGIISGVIAVILYLIVAGFVFAPIYNLLAPTIIACAGSGYGLMATSLLSIAIYVIMPLLLIVAMLTMSKPRTEYVQ